SVAVNGALSGTPSHGDVGATPFVVKVEDAALASDTATLNISVVSVYNAWSNQYSLAEGPTGDDDGDGLKNLAEYGLGGNPTNPSDRGYQPTYGLASGGGSNWLEYIHVQQTDPNSGLLYYLELSDNLVSNVWTNTGYTVVGSGPFTNGLDAVTNQISTDSKDQQFIRLKIEQN
ncbi:MAG: hypothetical protein HKP10_04435, partial [Kiritimatiellales bacterium]|nr:hypothetical protein [Kiritimatiellales bacterium]